MVVGGAGWVGCAGLDRGAAVVGAVVVISGAAVSGGAVWACDGALKVKIKEPRQLASGEGAQKRSTMTVLETGWD